MNIHAKPVPQAMYKSMAVPCVVNHFASGLVNRAIGYAGFYGLNAGQVRENRLIDVDGFRLQLAYGKVRVISDA